MAVMRRDFMALDSEPPPPYEAAGVAAPLGKELGRSEEEEEEEEESCPLLLLLLLLLPPPKKPPNDMVAMSYNVQR